MNKNFYYVHLLNIILLVGGNFFFLQEKYLQTNEINFFLGAAAYFIASIIFLSLLTYSNRFLFIFINSLFYILASSLSYFKYHYKIIISPVLIQSILNTDKLETLELINGSLITWILISGILPCILLAVFTRIFRTNYNKLQAINLFATGVILVIVSFSLTGRNIHSLRVLNNALLSFMPYNYIFALKNYFIIYQASNKHQIKKLTDIFSYEIEKKSMPMKIVLIIGESARSDHMEINGYARENNPNLFKVDNLVSYPHAYSNATNTPSGIEAIMKKQGFYNASSFIDIFNKIGFKTFWLSNQGTKYKTINAIAKESNISIFSDEIRGTKIGNNYDEDLLPFIKDAASSNENSLIVIHTIGSHRLYDLRYPASFKKFTPTCIQDQLYYSTHECTDKEELVNSYDNSILYTDYFITEVIKILSDKTAFLIYISDHGESLGENGVYAHAHPYESAPVEQLHIPLIIWASKYYLNDPILEQNFITAKNNKDNRIDQTYIFHTILDCLNIKSESIDLEKSLCSSR